MKKIFRYFLLPAAVCCGTAQMAGAQAVARIVVVAGQYARNNTPVSCALDDIPFLPDSSLQLVEVKGREKVNVPFQVEQGYHRRIWWILSGTSAPGTQREFELVKGDGGGRTGAAVIQAVDRQGTLLLQEAGSPVLQYNYATVYPPAGVDSLYRRSGFIHPLWAPNGAVLTNIHPKGHWHHVGIWNPWTHTLFEGKEVDFWNLQKKEGTVRFAGFAARTEGPVWGGFKALQEHVVLQKNGETQVALNEQWDVRIYPAQAEGSRRIWDMTSTFGCAGSSPLLLMQYRYGGGFGFRATREWNGKTSQVLTSEGRNRNASDSTRARWIKITGATGKGQAGMLVMCYPANYDAPELVRVWPEDNPEGGEIMLNYSPTKLKPWLLTYGKEYMLKYRVMVYNNDITAREADALWNDWAHPPLMKVAVLQP